MWIQTQNKQRIINTDQIIDIFIGRTGTKIVANTTCYDLDASEVVLGEYQDRDTSLKILEGLALVVGYKTPVITMPIGGDVDAWIKEVTVIAKAYVINDFKIHS